MNINYNIKRAVMYITIILAFAVTMLATACTPRQFVNFSASTSRPNACVLLAGHVDNDSRQYLTAGVIDVDYSKGTWTGTREDGSRLIMGYSLQEDSEIWNKRSCL